MSSAEPMDCDRRLDNYARQSGSDWLTSRQARRWLHKERHATGTTASTFIVASRAKNRPTRTRAA